MHDEITNITKWLITDTNGDIIQDHQNKLIIIPTQQISELQYTNTETNEQIPLLDGHVYIEMKNKYKQEFKKFIKKPINIKEFTKHIEDLSSKLINETTVPTFTKREQETLSKVNEKIVSYIIENDENFNKAKGRVIELLIEYVQENIFNFLDDINSQYTIHVSCIPGSINGIKTLLVLHSASTEEGYHTFITNGPTYFPAIELDYEQAEYVTNETFCITHTTKDDFTTTIKCNAALFNKHVEEATQVLNSN